MKFSQKFLISGTLCVLLLGACGGSDNDASAPPDEFQDKILQLCPLPQVAQLNIETENGESIRAKSEGYINASLDFQGPDAAGNTAPLTTEIRGRGNSTWTLSPKKPYTLKLNKKASLLGMPATKKWTLLANYGDKTMLRTAAAFCMARILDMPYTPDSEFVELSVNGVPQGLYQLTNKTYKVSEKIKEDKKQAADESDPAQLDDPFLLEVHWFLERDLHFQSSTGIPLQFRSEPDDDEFHRIVDWFNQFESIMTQTDDEQRLDKIKQQMDIRSLIDMLLVNELIGNHDAFLFSTHLFKLKGGLLTWGPAWDFDQSSGLTEPTFETDAWMLPFRTPPYNAPLWYFETLLKHPEFADLLQERWQHLHQHVPALRWVLHEFAKTLNDAQQRNFEIWPILGEKVFTNYVAFDTYDEEVDYLIDWMDRRDRWIHANIQELPAFGAGR